MISNDILKLKGVIIEFYKRKISTIPLFIKIKLVEPEKN